MECPSKTPLNSGQQILWNGTRAHKTCKGLKIKPTFWNTTTSRHGTDN
jgi:hypothetical protein